MDSLISEVTQLVNDWDVWSIKETNRDKRSVTIARSDEDQATIRIEATATFPRGPVTFTMIPEEYYDKTHRQENASISDGLDNALEKWQESDGMGMPSHSSYEGEPHSQHGFSGAVSEVIPAGQLEAAKARLQADISDARIGVFGYSYFKPSHSQFIVRIGVPLNTMDGFRARALGLDRSCGMFVEMEWSWAYMRDAAGDLPKVVDVFMCPPAAIRVDGEITDRRTVGPLKWFLSNRIGNAVRKNHILRERRLVGIVDEKGVVVEGLAWTFSGDYEKFYGSEHNENILLGIQSVIRHRLDHCTKVCLQCDDVLPLDGMKTAICEKPLCRHGLENYGLGTDVGTELTHPEVCELLISLTCAAAATGRSRDTFTPMCPVLLDGERFRSSGYQGPLHFFSGVGPSSYLGDQKNFELLTSICQKIPSLSLIMAESGGGKTEAVRKYLNSIDPLVFPLLQWILSSNRTHLEPIDPKNHFKGLGVHQFHLISSSPEKEKQFRVKRTSAAAKKLGRNGSGSFWAWHGSAPGNWHCILRAGLKNYSNTKFMSAGAAYGPGIYTAKNISTSLGYMAQPIGAWKGAERLNSPTGIVLIALCEIADVPAGYKDHGNNIVTIQDEDIICTRFLFAFPGGFNGDQSLHTDSIVIPEGALEAARGN